MTLTRRPLPFGGVEADRAEQCKPRQIRIRPVITSDTAKG